VHLSVLFFCQLDWEFGFDLRLSFNSVHVPTFVHFHGGVDQRFDVLILGDWHMLVRNKVQSDLPAKE